MRVFAIFIIFVAENSGHRDFGIFRFEKVGILVRYFCDWS